MPHYRYSQQVSVQFAISKSHIRLSLSGIYYIKNLFSEIIITVCWDSLPHESEETNMFTFLLSSLNCHVVSYRNKYTQTDNNWFLFKYIHNSGCTAAPFLLNRSTICSTRVINLSDSSVDKPIYTGLQLSSGHNTKSFRCIFKGLNKINEEEAEIIVLHNFHLRCQTEAAQEEFIVFWLYWVQYLWQDQQSRLFVVIRDSVAYFILVERCSWQWHALVLMKEIISCSYNLSGQLHFGRKLFLAVIQSIL